VFFPVPHLCVINVCNMYVCLCVLASKKQANGNSTGYLITGSPFLGVFSPGTMLTTGSTRKRQKLSTTKTNIKKGLLTLMQAPTGSCTKYPLTSLLSHMCMYSCCIYPYMYVFAGFTASQFYAEVLQKFGGQAPTNLSQKHKAIAEVVILFYNAMVCFSFCA